jgi:hypothetical protein
MPRWLDRLLCRIGAHYWSQPGGYCMSCGERDTFLDGPRVTRDGGTWIKPVSPPTAESRPPKGLPPR